MKTLKQITLLCLFWMIGMSALAYDFAVENADGVTIYYNITSSTSPKTVEVTNDGDTEFSVYTAETINIPNTVTYNGNTYGVTGIGVEAFYNAEEVKSIILPKCLTKIDSYAFMYCYSLTSVSIPNSVTSIRRGAFMSCSNLTSVTLPNSLTTIDGQAFCYTGLKQLSIPASVTNIGCSAFAYTSLEEVRIEDGDEFLSMCGSYYWSNSLTNGATFYQTRGIKKLYIGRNISSDCFVRGGWKGSESSIESIEIGAKGHYDDSSLESMNNLKYIRCYGGLKSIAKGLKNKLVCVPKGLKNEYLKMSCWRR